MRAIGLTRYGGPEVLEELVLPEPHAAPGQVRVRVRAAGVNPVDEMVRDGRLAGLFADASAPYVPGMDISGTIDEIGVDVDPAYGIELDQAVVGLVNSFGDYGGYSEFVCLPATSVIPKPSGASFHEAASFLMNALTARNALDHLRLPPASTLLVTGAAGAVGAHTVALANAERLNVLAVASSEDEDFLREAGAYIVLTRGEHLARRVREHFPQGVDAVVDTAQQLSQVVPAVRNGGAIVVMRRAADETSERGIRKQFLNVRDRATDHQALVRLGLQAGSGVLRMRVAKIFPASEAAAAHRMLAAGGLRGRIILDFNSAL